MDYALYLLLSASLGASLGIGYVLYKSERLFQREEKEGVSNLLTRNIDSESILETMAKDAIEVLRTK